MTASLTLVGFDSAWTDNPKKPGAICAMTSAGVGSWRFTPPFLSTFAAALEFIRQMSLESDCTIIALDQPTIVPNEKGCRPVERAAASVISWLGGGVQPSNRGRTGMFDDAAPLWTFLRKLGAAESPDKLRDASSGMHLAEVFPAIALSALSTDFHGRLAAPRYNPANRRRFRQDDWNRVATTVGFAFSELGMDGPATWCTDRFGVRPTKADQDCLDSLICLLIISRLRFGAPQATAVLGDTQTGYMLVPVASHSKERLFHAASEKSVRLRLLD